MRRKLRGLVSKPESSTVWDQPLDYFNPNGFKIYWGDLDQVRRHQRRAITGDPEKTLEDYFLDGLREKGRHDLRGLCIGCQQAMRPEATFLRSGLFREVVVLDIAEQLLERQQARADAERLAIQYLRTDLNEAVLEPQGFDFIYAGGTIHHIANLEHLFTQIKGALRPDGLFAMLEFVGPTQFQWSAEQMSIVNGVLAALPARYRVRTNGRVKARHVKPRVKDVVRVDPSEAVRSAEILPILAQHLRVTQSVELGGAMLHILMDGIAGHLETDDQGQKILEGLIAMDQALTRSGMLASDFVFVMAENFAPSPINQLGNDGIKK